jgi:Na+-driven multidrug efflux pump
MNKVKNFGYAVASTLAALPAMVSAAAFDTGLDKAQNSAGLPSTAAQGGVVGFLSTILNWLLGILGVVALIAFVIAGFMYIFSAGDEEKAEKAKNTMLYAIIGVVVALIGYIIIKVIQGFLNGNVTGI